MFDTLVRDIDRQFALGGHGKELLQLLLANISEPGHGGLPAFVQGLRAFGGDWGRLLDTWIDPKGAGVANLHVNPPALAPALVEQAFDGVDGVLPAAAARFGLSREVVVRALGYVLPIVLRRFSQGGRLMAALPPEAEAFVGDRAAWRLGPPPPGAALPDVPSDKPTNWLPWMLGAGVLAALLGFCTARKDDGTAVPPPIAASAPAAHAPASAAASAPASNAAASAAQAAASGVLTLPAAPSASPAATSGLAAAPTGASAAASAP